jgi:hypothetical protein
VLRGSVAKNGGLLMSVTKDLVISMYDRYIQRLMSDAEDPRTYIIVRILSIRDSSVRYIEC